MPAKPITHEQVGQLVRYYDNGWHTGVLVSLTAEIKPAVRKRTKKMPAKECEKLEENK
jgi:hypothetical protein